MSEKVEKTEDGKIKVTKTTEVESVVSVMDLEQELLNKKNLLSRRQEVMQTEIDNLQAEVDKAQQILNQAKALITEE